MFVIRRGISLIGTLPLAKMSRTSKPLIGTPSFLFRKKERKKGKGEWKGDKRKKRMAWRYTSLWFIKTLGLLWVSDGFVKIAFIDFGIRLFCPSGGTFETELDFEYRKCWVGKVRT
jgi:hypothetical protein